MSGLFSSLYISKKGMMAHQTALNVVSHNIANADTDGYSVQRANIKTTEPFGMPSIYTAGQVGQIGTGSIVASIDRSRDEFLDTQIRKEDSTLGKYNIREQFLSDVEGVLNDSSKTGLASVLDNFWDSWQQLSTNSEPDSTARTLVLQNAESLATTINQDYEKLQNFENNAGDLIQQQVFEVNNILTQINDLNDQIKAVKVGGEIPNDLYDRRDLLLDQLSERYNFNISKDDFDGVTINGLVENGEVDLAGSNSNPGVVSYLESIDGDGTAHILIGGDINNEKDITLRSDEIKQYKNDDGTYKFKTILYNKDTGKIEPANFTSGSLNGLNTINRDIGIYKKDLNNLAKVLAVSVNTIHSGSTVDGEGANFFDPEAETSNEAASNLKVIITKPDDINAGSAIKYDSNGNLIPSDSTGNGERATMIGQLRNTVMDVLGISNSTSNIRKAFANSVLGGNTDLKDISNIKLQSASSGNSINSYYKSTVTALGVSNQEAKRMVTNQNALLSQLKSRRDSISGVSLDEEITNMIQFQRSYQANAKMISVIDELLSTVVNGLIK